MGFGLAAVVFSPLKRQMIRSLGVDGTLLVLSFFVAFVALVGARLIKNPPEEYRCPSKKASKKVATTVSSAVIIDISPKQFVKTKVFYILWLALAMVIGGGLTAIGLIPAYGELVLALNIWA